MSDEKAVTAIREYLKIGLARLIRLARYIRLVHLLASRPFASCPFDTQVEYTEALS